MPNRKSIPDEVGDRGEHPEAESEGEDVGDEVQRPTLVRSLRDHERSPCAGSLLAALLALHLQPPLSQELLQIAPLKGPAFRRLGGLLPLIPQVLRHRTHQHGDHAVSAGAAD